MALLEEAADAELLIIGSWQQMKLERVFDSVAIERAQRSPCPLIAVPLGAVAQEDVVAVAFDDSDSSRAALAWADSLAACRRK